MRIKQFKWLYYLVFILSISCNKENNSPLKEYIELPDKNFEQILINDSLDTEGKLDGRLLLSDALKITHLNISSYIESLEGIASLENLTNLFLTTSQTLQLDLSKNLKLDTLRIHGIHIPDFDISLNTNLELVSLIGMGLSQMDFRPNHLLKTINIYGNPLKTLYVNSSVERLDLHNTQIKQIDLSNAWNLSYLDCHSSFLDSLDLSANPKMDFLDCTYNYIRKLTLPNVPCQGLAIGELHIEKNRGMIADVCVCDKEQAELHLKRKLYIPYHNWTFAWTKDGVTTFKKCTD